MEVSHNFEIRKRLWSLSIMRKPHISRNERLEFAKVSRELIEKLTKVTDLY